MRILAAVSTVWTACWTGAAAAPQPSPVDLIYTEAPRYVPDAARKGRDRFPDGARLMLSRGGASRPLVPAFAASSDAALSFDGARVLFSGRKAAADPWRIWEISLAGGAPRQVSTGEGDCLRPVYLPLQKAVYTRRTQGGSQIEIAPLTGRTTSRLTFAPGHFLVSAVLRDGRVLFEGDDLYTVYSDGSGFESYRCDHGPARFAASQLACGDIVFQTADGFGRFSSPSARQLPVSLPAGEYYGPVAESGGRWLAACRGGICAVAPGGGQPPAMLLSGNAWQPVPIEKRPVPPYHPSGLGESESARLLCLNAYASQAGGLAPGSIAGVRLWSLDAGGGAVALGHTTVEGDGSFFVQVPPDRPLRFELFGRGGATLRAGEHFFWSRPGEQRVCVGCHTGPARAPDNLAPRVLERSQTPVVLGTAGGR